MNTTWLKVWIGIGTVAAIAVFAFPPILGKIASDDVQRYRECVGGTRTDCERSMVWNLVDAAVLFQQQNGGSLTGTPYEGLGGSGGSEATRTSEDAPFISKVEPKGMSNTNGVYYATAGSEIVFRATITGVITSADLYKVELVDGEIKRPEKIVPFARAEGDVWEARYALTPGFVGSVEVRAYGTDPKDLAVLALPVAAK